MNEINKLIDEIIRLTFIDGVNSKAQIRVKAKILKEKLGVIKYD